MCMVFAVLPAIGYRLSATDSRLKFVADTPHGLHVARSLRVRFDLLAEPPDVDGDRPAVAGVRPIPNLVEQFVACEDLTRMLGQEFEQVEFAGGQLDRLPGDLDLTPVRPN